MGKVQQQLEAYLAENLLPGRERGGRLQRFFVGLLERMLLKWATAHMHYEAHTVPLLIPITIPEVDIPLTEDEDVSLSLPEYTFFLHLGLGLVEDPSWRRGSGVGLRVRDLRATISDAELGRILSAVNEQIVRWDLRALDPRLQGFTEPLCMNFRFSLDWPTSGKEIRASFRNFNLDLHLPS